MVKLFSGSANPELSEEVAGILGIPLAKSEVVRFGNSEVKVSIKEKVKDATCVVIQPTSNPTDTNLMELFFFADALKRSGAKEIIAVIPYFGYARQNREHLPGESVSVNVVIRFIEAAGYDAVYTLTLHDEGTEGIFSVTFKNINAFKILGKEVYNYLTKEGEGRPKPDSAVVVSPDQGGVERAQVFAEHFFHTGNIDIAVIEKRRNLEKIHQSKALNLYGDVKDKVCIIVDDIITSGGTLIHAAELCLKKGAKRVIACIVHHDFSPTAPQVLSSEKNPIEKIFTANTIALKPEQRFPSLVEVSIAPLIAAELQKELSI